MAHKKAGGSTALGRDSQAKRLGVKIYGNQKVKQGDIIIRQRGTKYEPGLNVGLGKDDTIFSKIDGTVKFERKSKLKFSGQVQYKTRVSVEPVK